MTIIAWIVIGAIAGWVAQYILKTRTGLVMMIGFGIVAAIVGGAVGSFLTGGGFDFNNLITGINFTSIVVAIIGAVALGAPAAGGPTVRQPGLRAVEPGWVAGTPGRVFVSPAVSIRRIGLIPICAICPAWPIPA